MGSFFWHNTDKILRSLTATWIPQCVFQSCHSFGFLPYKMAKKNKNVSLRSSRVVHWHWSGTGTLKHSTALSNVKTLKGIFILFFLISPVLEHSKENHNEHSEAHAHTRNRSSSPSTAKHLWNIMKRIIYIHKQCTQVFKNTPNQKTPKPRVWSRKPPTAVLHIPQSDLIFFI